jgi:hypothetical protein
MLQDELLDLIDRALRPLGSAPVAGEEYRAPPLDVLRFYHRFVRLHWVPLLGWASSVVAVAHQPSDVAGTAEGQRRLLERVAKAVNGRFPPWRPRHGLAIGLTTLVLTPEPIGPSDDEMLKSSLTGLARMRCVPFGLIRLNLGQEAMAFALAQGPDNLFPEPIALADALTASFRRFVAPLD